MFRSFPIRNAFVVIAVLLAASLEAQTTTGRLIGTVTDGEAAVLPGVTVTVNSPALIGGHQVRITDERGEFTFIGLAPGEYVVSAALHGFITQERSEVKVNLGGATALTIALPMGTFGGEVEVVAETPVVDPTQVNTEQLFDESYLQNAAIGTLGRDYTSVLTQAAGVAGSDNPNVFGSTLSENAYYIDGIDTTDPVTATWGTSFNYDAIAEVQFQTSGFEAEYGRATGGLINVVTKSGGNLFSGTLDVRYRDDSMVESGDHYDSSQLNQAFQDIAATLGGPLLRDKVWFFASYEYINSEFTPIGSPTTRDWEGINYLGKVTWQADQAWRVVGKYSDTPTDIANDDADRFHAVEATTFQEQGTGIFTGDISGVLSDSLLLGIRGGTYDSVLNAYPQTGDLEAISHTNGITGMVTGNNPNQQYSQRNRAEVSANLSWFVDNLAGSHEFKGGLEYAGLDFSASNCSTGTPGGVECTGGVAGLTFTDTEYGGDWPWLMWENVAGGMQEYKGVLSTAYAQDAWRPIPNLTLKFGVRYDDVSYDNNQNTPIADLSMWQPRFGAAWDITGDAKNVARVNYGRFMHPSALTLPWQVRATDEPGYRWYSCSGVLPLAFGIDIASAEECEAFAAANAGWDYRTDPQNWDPLGWVLSPGEHYGSDPNGIDPDVRATYADTLTLAFEREVGNRASIEVAYIDKKTRNVIEDTCDGNLGPDGPSADAECNSYILGNLVAGNLGRDYSGFIVRYESRTFDWMTLLTSYTYSKSKGNMENTQGGNADFDFYPWHWENRYGYLSDHRLHRFKLNGYFNIKGDWTIGFDSFWSSAFTWEPQEGPADNPEIPYGFAFLEPRGSEEANSNYQIDLQLTKGFNIGNVRLALIGSVYNALSSEEPTVVCNSVSGCGTHDNGDPILAGDATNWQTPRRYELGFRVEF